MDGPAARPAEPGRDAGIVDGLLGPMPASSAEKVHELTGGNPLLLTTVLTACPALHPTASS
ncbi:hypothetical protein AB0F72_26065 [Actinoplanes sp. NPDC023936]|uniref:hypothetical protein n=1 Tax=Actinoplanes sp. NPDC023936 TaxID=3154910 RepID=UPI00340C60F7